MKLDNILPPFVTICFIVGFGIYAYQGFLFFKKKYTSIQPPIGIQSEYNAANEYRQQQEDKKAKNKECIRIVADYLKGYGHNVTYIYTINLEVTGWRYNVAGSITNSDGTTRLFEVQYDYSTKSILTCYID